MVRGRNQVYLFFVWYLIASAAFTARSSISHWIVLMPFVVKQPNLWVDLLSIYFSVFFPILYSLNYCGLLILKKKSLLSIFISAYLLYTTWICWPLTFLLRKNIGIGVRQIYLKNIALSPHDGDVVSRKSVRKKYPKLGNKAKRWLRVIMKHCLIDLPNDYSLL